MRFNMKQQQESDALKQLQWSSLNHNSAPIIKVPLQFMFPPVEALSKELTKLNSNHRYRIVYLGPRWENSVTFHKQYSKSAGYEFDEKKVNSNNNFCQDSMNHNQFYKRQIYYRAFEGMNPTIKPSEDLIFQSRFESGNLDCVVRVGPNEYDLFLRIDSNTRGNISWFYFLVKSACKRSAKLNICNLTKTNTHYSKGLNPFVCRSNTNNWSQEGFQNLKFSEKKLRYDFLSEKVVNMGTFYELSFEFQFKNDEEVRFAYCIPYTYSDLLSDLKKLPKKIEIGCIGQSLTGLNIPYVCFGKDAEQNKKPVLLITGRVHPSESNSSLIISRLMKQLCMNEEMRYLREKLIIIIVPMLNPDGVTLGNSRAGASGKDLNRQFRTKNQALFPEISALKAFIAKISEDFSIDMYLDFHGHSRKKNMFVFGPDYSVTEPMYYKCRILPKLLSSITPIFRYYGCSYQISHDKKSTARAAMLREMLIPYVYTVQTSLGFYYDAVTQQTIRFDRETWQNLGLSMLKALSEYYLSIQQLQEYMQARKKAKRVASRNSSSNQSYVDPLKTKNNDGKHQQKNLKVLQIYRQIKLLDEKRPKINRQENSSNSQSDSYDSKQELEKEKMNQFNFMVTECIKDEQNRRYRASSMEESSSKKAKPEKQRRLAILKRRQERQKAQEDLLGQFQLELQNCLERETIKSQMQTRSHAINCNTKGQRGVAVAHQCLRQGFCKDKLISIIQQQRKADDSEQNYDKKSHKINVRMFNFHKAISDIDQSRNAGLRKKDSKSIKHNNHHFSLQHHKSSVTPLHAFKFSSKKQPEKINQSLHQSKTSNESEVTQQLGYCKSGEIKQREKYKFPPSYYKIRYQSKRRELELKKQKSYQEHFDIRNAFQPKPEQRRVLSFASFEDKLQKNKEVINQRQSNSQDGYGLFARISQFPLL